MNNNEYQVGGSLSIDAPTYVIRQADENLYQALKHSHYCYVLNCRQMGKSSLGIRAWQRLQDEEIACAFIDLTEFGSENDATREQWYWSLINSLLSAFQLWEQFDLETWWQKRSRLTLTKRFSEFIEEILLNKIDQPIVIFLDEIDSVLGLEFCLDDFFALIRYFYNQRAINSQFKRLTFAFLGVATPSDLIQDPTKTPFNIGMGIELQGFQLAEVKPLIKGLQKKTNDPHSVMEEILRWTGGQPFLTQKLCQLVSQIDSKIIKGNKRQQIEELVKATIINDWEDRDDPPHLKTIKQRILRDKKYQINLLEIYQQILEKKEILTNKIEPEIVLKLRLSGLVVQQTEKIKVYNEIYQTIFNAEWIDRQLETIRPYARSMRAWYASGCKNHSKLLRGKALQEALQWKDDKNLSHKDHQYLNASKESKYHRKMRNILLIFGSFFVGTIISGALVYKQVYEKYAFCPREQGIVGEKIGDICFRTLITSGEKKAFLSSTNFHLEMGTKYFNEGTEYFKKGKDDEAIKSFEQAIKLFEQAKKGDPSDPVPQIYLNNAKARLQENPIKLAVPVPIDNFEEIAKEILKGVADAQTQFNNNEGKNGRLLEIVIANDGNQESIAKEIAKSLAARQDILGIIGHQQSESTQAALPIYKENRLATITPTSTSSELKNDVFFRAVSSTKVAAPTYAKYIQQKLLLDKLVVFYDSDSLYSRSFKKDFETAFKKRRGKIVNSHSPIDLADPQLDIKKEIQEIIKQNIKAVLLIPSGKTTTVAIAIARENFDLPPSQKFQLLGSLALFQGGTLSKGRKAIEGMSLANPCLTEKSDYMKQAANRWQQKISWRTATSYDATQAFIEAIRLSSSQPTREEILNNLKNLKLPVDKTSGFGLDFSNAKHSNDNRKYCLFEIRNNSFEEILEK